MLRKGIMECPWPKIKCKNHSNCELRIQRHTQKRSNPYCERTVDTSEKHERKLIFEKFNGQQYFLLLMPLFLVASTYCAFQLFCTLLGLKLGYLFGFLFYWIVWCMIVPYVLLKREGIRMLFRKPEKGHHNWVNTVLLVVPCVFAIFGGPFFVRLTKVNLQIVVLSFLIVVINALGEEVLWRGVYLHFFKKPMMGFLFPLISFSIWHIAPNSVNPSSWCATISSVLWSFRRVPGHRRVPNQVRTLDTVIPHHSGLFWLWRYILFGFHLLTISGT